MRASLPARLRRPRGEAGTTLIEVLAAIIVFGLLASAVLATLLKTLNLTADNSRRVAAANIAARQIEIARHMSLSALQAAASPLVYTYTVSGKQYTVTQTTAPTTQCGTSTCDASVGSQVLYERVTVVVTWPNMGATKPVRSDTLRLLAGPAAVTTGSIRVTVTGARGQVQAGLPVQLSNAVGRTWTVITDSTGVATFTSLGPGTDYAASVTASGYVDPKDSTVASTNNISVTAGLVTSVTLRFDLSASITVSFNPVAGYPVPSTLAATLQGPTEPTVVMTGNGTTRTANGLYPEPAGYPGWAGDCSDAAPAGYGAQPQTFPVNTSNGTVATVGVSVAPRHGSQVYVATNVYAWHAPDTGSTGCPQGESYFLGTSLIGLPVKASLPYGLWYFTSNPTASSPPAGGWTSQKLTPASANPGGTLAVSF